MKIKNDKDKILLFLYKYLTIKTLELQATPWYRPILYHKKYYEVLGVANMYNDFLKFVKEIEEDEKY